MILITSFWCYFLFFKVFSSDSNNCGVGVLNGVFSIVLVFPFVCWCFGSVFECLVSL